MNKVITIHLHGTAYQLEEGGYEALRAYLDQAARQLEPNPDRAEILADIEQAIGEKFRALLTSSRNVVLTAEVKAVITEMGPVTDGSEAAPEDPGAAAPNSAPPPTGAAGPAGPAGPTRRLYRIYDGAIVSGVCNGIAAHLGVDVSLIRLAVVLLTFLSFGAVAAVYFLAVVIIPEAKTPEEKAAATGPSPTAQEFIRMARDGYYEGLKSIHDRHARREWKHKFRREMRDWKRSFRWEMRWHPRWGMSAGTCATPAGSLVVVPLLSTLKALLFFALWFAIFSLVGTHAVFGVPLPAGIPLWAGVILLLLAYQVVVAPVRALRRAYYYRSLDGPWGWHPFAELWRGLIGIGVLILSVLLADRLIPGFHQALLALPDFLQHVTDTVQQWWSPK